MKKYFSFIIAIATLFAMHSCSQEEVIGNETSGDEVEVAFNLEMEGQTASRTIGDGTTVKNLCFGAYIKDDNNFTYVPTLKPTNLPEDGSPIQFVDKKAKVELRLVKGQTYRFFFWAQTENGEDYYTIDMENHKVTVKYTEDNKAAANNEKRDAFYAMQEYTISGPLNQPITLKRPFAQVNVGVKIGELKEAKETSLIDITKSSFTFNNVNTELDVFDGKTSNPKAITYYGFDIPESNKTDEEGDLKKVENTNYEYIAMNYVLATEEGKPATVTDASFTVYAGEKEINTWSVPNLTIQRNWRTNIITSLMSDAEFNIVIDPIFADDYNYPKTEDEALQFAASNGGEVTLTEDVNLSILNVTADMVINMAGKTLKGSINLAEGVNLTINDGNIEPNNDTEVKNGITSNGNLTLNNVNINSTRHTVRIESGTAVINGGTYRVSPISSSTLSAVHVGDDNTVANVTIKGGTFIGPKGTMADSGSAVSVKKNSSVTIEGGEFSKGKNNTLSAIGTLTVKGGTFDQDPKAYVAEGYSSEKSGNWYYVGEKVTDIVLNGNKAEVYTAKGLLQFLNIVNTQRSYSLKLMRNIEMPLYTIEKNADGAYEYTDTPITIDENGVPSGSNWVPMCADITDYSDGFNGEIDGNGMTIYNLYMNRDAKYTSFVGFMFNKGVIKNLTIANSAIKGNERTGIIAGWSQNGSIIENVHVANSTITGTEEVGGIVGRNYRREGGSSNYNEEIAYIKNCTTDENTKVVATSSQVGGICGLNYGAAIINCINNADVTGTSRVGGIVGYSRDYWANKTNGSIIADVYVIACESTEKAQIIANNGSAGGIIGEGLADNDNHKYTNCYVVACHSSSEISGKSKGTIIGKISHETNIVASWTKKKNSLVIAGGNTEATLTASAQYEKPTEITEAIVAEMNTAIENFNNKNAEKIQCPYKWSWTSGSWPVLVAQ